MRDYVYTNELGHRKSLTITPLENGNYYAIMWCLDNGDCCGIGEITQAQLDEVLAHYSDVREVSEK